MTKLEEMGARAKKAAHTLAVLGPEKEAALMKAAQALLAHEEEILMANREDLAAGEEKERTLVRPRPKEASPARVARTLPQKPPKKKHSSFAKPKMNCLKSRWSQSRHVAKRWSFPTNVR